MEFKLPDKIKLEIVTPDGLLFSGKVDEVVVPAAEGYLGVLPGHAPLISILKIGVISFKESGRETRLFCSWGFVEVLPDRVSVLAEIAESADSIDVEKANVDRVKAEELLRSKDPGTDYEEATRQLEQAQARLEIAGR